MYSTHTVLSSLSPPAPPFHTTPQTVLGPPVISDRPSPIVPYSQSHCGISTPSCWTAALGPSSSSSVFRLIIIYMCPIPQPLLHGRCGTSPPTRASETSARCTGVTCPPARVSPTPTVTRPTDSQTTPEGSVFPSGAHSHRIYPPRCERLSTAPRVGGAALYVEGVVYRGRGVCRSGLCGSPAAAAPW